MDYLKYWALGKQMASKKKCLSLKFPGWFSCDVMMAEFTGLRNKPDIAFAECQVPVKQLMVKKVRDYRVKGSKEYSLLAEIHIVKLKAAKLSRFLSQISVKFFNISQK